MRDILKGGTGLLLVVGAILFVTMTGCATERYYHSGKRPGAIKVYEEAKGLYDQKQYDNAEKSFQEFIVNYPDSPLGEVAMFYLGSCYKEKNEYQNAISSYQELIDRYPYSVWADSARKEIEKIKSAQEK